MTEFEKQLPILNFEMAGRKAYHMGVDLSNNPYPLDPWRDRWDKGWRSARKSDPDAWINRNHQPRYAPGAPALPRQKWNRHKRAAQAQPLEPGKFVANFNQTHRTAV